MQSAESTTSWHNGVPVGGAAVGANVGAAVGDSVGNAVGDAVGGAVGDAVGGALGDAVFGSAVVGTVGAAVGAEGVVKYVVVVVIVVVVIVVEAAVVVVAVVAGVGVGVGATGRSPLHLSNPTGHESVAVSTLRQNFTPVKIPDGSFRMQGWVSVVGRTPPDDASWWQVTALHNGAVRSVVVAVVNAVLVAVGAGVVSLGLVSGSTVPGVPVVSGGHFPQRDGQRSCAANDIIGWVHVETGRSVHRAASKHAPSPLRLSLLDEDIAPKVVSTDGVVVVVLVVVSG